MSVPERPHHDARGPDRWPFEGFWVVLHGEVVAEVASSRAEAEQVARDLIIQTDPDGRLAWVEVILGSELDAGYVQASVGQPATAAPGSPFNDHTRPEFLDAPTRSQDGRGR